MSISSLSISRVGAAPRICKERSGIEARRARVVAVECSSRPQKKATAHHIKTRPKKHQAWDIKRKPTVYPPLPTLPPDWTLLERPLASSSSEEEEAEEGAIDAVAEDTKEAIVVSPSQ